LRIFAPPFWTFFCSVISNVQNLFAVWGEKNPSCWEPPYPKKTQPIPGSFSKGIWLCEKPPPPPFFSPSLLRHLTPLEQHCLTLAEPILSLFRQLRFLPPPLAYAHQTALPAKPSHSVFFRLKPIGLFSSRVAAVFLS